MHATIDCDRRLCIHTVKYATTHRIIDKKGRGRRKSSSLTAFNARTKFVDHACDKSALSLYFQ